MEWIQMVNVQIWLLIWLWIPIESRRLTYDGQKCSKVMIVADNVMGEIDFALTWEYLNVLRFVEATSTL